MDLPCDFFLSAEVLNDARLLGQIKALRLFPFPQSPAEIRAESEKFKDLSAEERLNRLFIFLRECEEFLDHNPAIREAYERYKGESEAAWQRAQRDLFERCGAYCNADQ